jgi:hypothetical protein
MNPENIPLPESPYMQNTRANESEIRDTSPAYSAGFPPIDVGALLGRIGELERQNAALAARSAVIHPESTHATLPKIKLPEKFDGNRSNYRGFINQLHLVFRLHADKYPTTEIRVAFVGTLLTGKALAWFNPIIEHPERYQAQWASWDAFLKHFAAQFAPIDPAITSANKIRRLRQGNSPASSYAAEFIQLASDLDWNDSALINMFRSGLSDAVKDMLVHYDYPDTLSLAMELAIRCDTRLHETRLERSGRDFSSPRAFVSRPNDTPTVSFPNAPSTRSSVSDPMEIDAVSRPRGPLSQAEKDRRRAAGLCLYCGGKHDISTHNLPSSRRVASVEAESKSEAETSGNVQSQ